MMITTKAIDWTAIEMALDQDDTAKERLLGALHELKEAHKKTNPETGAAMPDCECMTKVVSVIRLIEDSD